MSGVGNVGDFHKTFFVGECAYIGFHPSFSALGIAQASLALLSLKRDFGGLVVMAIGDSRNSRYSLNR